MKMGSWLVILIQIDHWTALRTLVEHHMVMKRVIYHLLGLKMKYWMARLMVLEHSNGLEDVVGALDVLEDCKLEDKHVGKAVHDGLEG